MQPMDSDRSGQTAGKDEIDIRAATPAGVRPRGRDRRTDMSSLFGGYQGPERRSGRDRRAQAQRGASS